MIDDEDPQWIAAIGQMQKAEKVLPDEPLWSVGAVQSLADVVAQIEHLITDEQRAILIGVGAMLVREGNKETMAGLQAFLAIGRAGGKQ